jgi:GNAT superfamily N-acetyltransferase
VLDPTRTSAVSVRQATIDDIPMVACIHVRSWQHAYRGQVPDTVLDALDIEQRAARWRKGFGGPGSALWVGMLDARVVGFCSMMPSRDAGAEPRTAEVAAIYIDPDHHRSGVGTALMQAALDEARCRGDLVLTLWVLATNQSARRFYERCGLTWDGASKVEQRPGYTMHELRYRIELGARRSSD